MSSCDVRYQTARLHLTLLSQLHGATDCLFRLQSCYFTTRNLLFRRANSNHLSCGTVRRRVRWTALLPANRDFWCAAIPYLRRCPSATLRRLTAAVNNRLHGQVSRGQLNAHRRHAAHVTSRATADCIVVLMHVAHVIAEGCTNVCRTGQYWDVWCCAGTRRNAAWYCNSVKLLSFSDWLKGAESVWRN